jgi:hypothetical protein
MTPYRNKGAEAMPILAICDEMHIQNIAYSIKKPSGK